MSNNILISALDWGMGHASRCVPIIRKLVSEKKHIYIAGSEQQIIFFKLYFHNSVQYLICPSYKIRYSKKLPLLFKVIIQLPRIIITKRKEHRWLKKAVRENNIDLIISDNRFGMYNSNVKSIYITHQLNIKSGTPFQFAIKWHVKTMNAFTEVWIPDSKDGISGELTFPAPKLQTKIKFIGPLSALKKAGLKKIDNRILVLLSGPEPQREILESKLLELLPRIESAKEIFVVRGSFTTIKDKPIDSKIRIIDFAQGDELSTLIEEAEIIICRSGYSSLMDLCLFESSAVLIPTPGQSEQEYLAERMNQKFKIPFLHQKALHEKSLENAMEKAKKTRFPFAEKTNEIEQELAQV